MISKIFVINKNITTNWIFNYSNITKVDHINNHNSYISINLYIYINLYINFGIYINPNIYMSANIDLITTSLCKMIINLYQITLLPRCWNDYKCILKRLYWEITFGRLECPSWIWSTNLVDCMSPCLGLTRSIVNPQ